MPLLFAIVKASAPESAVTLNNLHIDRAFLIQSLPFDARDLNRFVSLRKAQMLSFQPHPRANTTGLFDSQVENRTTTCAISLSESFRAMELTIRSVTRAPPDVTPPAITTPRPTAVTMKEAPKVSGVKARPTTETMPPAAPATLPLRFVISTSRDFPSRPRAISTNELRVARRQSLHCKKLS